ncbi:hypothetical protein I552_2987 [Mycobacterium xenopi 3993]|nr:hypothetical protein I552_2987 [Mycobacterium xenopi 3993]
MGFGMPARPQPLGVFPLPLGYMLIPPAEHTEAAAPRCWPGACPNTGRRLCAPTSSPSAVSGKARSRRWRCRPRPAIR